MSLFNSHHSDAAVAACVKYKVNDAKSCSDLKVTFDFEECNQEPQAGSMNARIVSCADDLAVAEVKTASALYTLKLKKDTDTFAGTFAGASDVNRKSIKPKKVESVTPPSPVVTTAQPTPVMAAPVPVAAPASSPASTVSFSGFIDGQYQLSSIGDYSKQYVIQDAALYITHVTPQTEAKFDLPISMQNASNTDSNFSVGATRAQAYVLWKIDPKFRAKMGQFDTGYGFEGNDTVDLILSRQGKVYNFADPFTHTGLQLAYDVSSVLTLNALAADPADSGPARDKNLQYGLQAALNSRVRGSAGFLFSRDKSTQLNTWLWDGVIGITLADVLNIDFEANLSKTGTASFEPAFLLQTSYQATPVVSWAVRGEYLKKRGRTDAASDPLLDRQYTLATGPQFKISEAARLKLDYTMQYDQNYSANSKVRIHGANVSLVHRFQ